MLLTKHLLSKVYYVNDKCLNKINYLASINMIKYWIFLYWTWPCNIEYYIWFFISKCKLQHCLYIPAILITMSGLYTVLTTFCYMHICPFYKHYCQYFNVIFSYLQQFGISFQKITTNYIMSINLMLVEQ